MVLLECSCTCDMRHASQGSVDVFRCSHACLIFVISSVAHHEFDHKRLFQFWDVEDNIYVLLDFFLASFFLDSFGSFHFVEQGGEEVGALSGAVGFADDPVYQSQCGMFCQILQSS